MKKIKISSLAILVLLFLGSGCDAVQNANNKQKGGVIGAAGGAVIGGVVGNNVGKGNTALGAIIGGVVGGAAGAYIGDRMDRQAERIESEIPGADVTRVGEGINVTFDESSGVYFDSAKYNINSTSATTLDKLAGIFTEFPQSNILIEGHTDSDGSESYNMKLSQNRAEAVTGYLLSKGLDNSRFTTRWYGETQPKYENDTAAGKAKNRRVELAIVASDELKEEAKTKAQ